MVSTTSGWVKIFLALALRPTQDFIKYLFLFGCRRIVEQLESVLLKLLNRIIHVIRVMFNGDAATGSKLVDVFVTVVN